jgi:hypothetical protein
MKPHPVQVGCAPTTPLGCSAETAHSRSPRHSARARVTIERTFDLLAGAASLVGAD